MRSKAASITLLCVCQVLALSLWFSATAVVPALVRDHGLSAARASLYSSAVSVGFVVGTLASAILGLADRLEPRRFFAGSALVAAVANAAILALPPGSLVVIVLRFVTGACMAGVYPVGMKMAASWARGDMGLLVGLLVGALTLGSASPHLFNALGGIDWRFTVVAASASALSSALLVRVVTLGPARAAPRRFEPRIALLAWTTPSVRLANLGYLGHMWELYAMWAWIGVFLRHSFEVSGQDAASALARLSGFAVIAVGAVGCVVAGALADRIGRTTTTMLAMATSGTCALAAGLLYGGNPAWLVALCLVWGVAVVADSAQFSSSVIELSEPEHVGTLLTVQTSVGFLLTLGTIHLVPAFAATWGWQHAFAPLAVGPYLGVVAMLHLRRRPESTRLAAGRR